MPLPIRAIHQQFDPRRIAGCNLWIDFSDRSTMTLVDNLISKINDKSGNGLHGEQTTAANRPSLSTVNGLTCGNWGTATNSIAITNSTLGLNLQSATIVAQWDDASNPSVAGALFTARSGGGFPAIPLGYGAGTSWYTTGTYGTNIWLNRTLTTTFLPAMRTSAAVVQGHATSSASLEGYSIGQDRPPTIGGNRGWFGRICEVVCYSRQLTTDERNWLAYEVAKKWGIAP